VRTGGTCSLVYMLEVCEAKKSYVYVSSRREFSRIEIVEDDKIHHATSAQQSKQHRITGRRGRCGVWHLLADEVIQETRDNR